jgi:hypothetical protein
MNIVAKIRARRAQARTRAAVRRVVEGANTPSMRHELSIIAQSHLNSLR